jgi:hypothetical protein
MTCLSQEAQQDISVAQFAETVTQTFRQIAGVG